MNSTFQIPTEIYYLSVCTKSIDRVPWKSYLNYIEFYDSKTMICAKDPMQLPWYQNNQEPQRLLTHDYNPQISHLLCFLKSPL